ncbi:PqqD family protein [Liberiplasma polymorphum]|uniref:PqqD family protein n=1 Tax=Liberiplasma polymorphum TaxID=3374570 RepID=UPI00377368C8
MKIKSEYVLRSVAGEHIVVPTGQAAVNFNGIITLNNSGKLLFEALKEGATLAELVILLQETYDVSEAVALNDVETFVNLLKSKDLFE